MSEYKSDNVSPVTSELCNLTIQSVPDEENPDIKINETNNLSPSGKYRVDAVHKTTKGFFTLTDAKFVNLSTGNVIYEIKDSALFTLQFFTRRGEEWVRSGQHYMVQLFINLDKEEIYDDVAKIKESDSFKSGCAFCWSSMNITDDGNTLIVDGYYWACPYEVKFYNFSNPSMGWPEIGVWSSNNNCGDDQEKDEYGNQLSCDRFEDFQFNDIKHEEDGTIVFIDTEPVEISVLKKCRRVDTVDELTGDKTSKIIVDCTCDFGEEYINRKKEREENERVKLENIQQRDRDLYFQTLDPTKNIFTRWFNNLLLSDTSATGEKIKSEDKEEVIVKIKALQSLIPNTADGNSLKIGCKGGSSGRDFSEHVYYFLCMDISSAEILKESILSGTIYNLRKNIPLDAINLIFTFNFSVNGKDEILTLNVGMDFVETENEGLYDYIADECKLKISVY